MGRATYLTVLGILCLVSPAAAQEAFRLETVQDRPFDYTDTYFLDVLGFQLPEDWQDEWDGARSGYRATVGSVRTNEFYVDQEARMGWDFGPHTHGHLQLFQREDFDSRYVRIVTGGDLDLLDRATLGVFSTLLPAKEQMDIGYSATYLVDRTHYLSLSLTHVDALFNRKSEGGDRQSGRPYTVKLQGAFRPVNGWTSTFRVGQDLPIRMIFADDGFEFDHRKLFYGARIQGRLSDAWTVVARVSGENGTRERDYADPLDPDNMEQRRDHVRARLESTWGIGRYAATLGMDYFYLYERTDRPANTIADRLIHRRETTVYGALRTPLPGTERFFFRPAIYVARMDDRDLYPNDPVLTDRVRGLRGKMILGLEYGITGSVRLHVNATARLETFEFGGGNGQIQVVF